MYGFMGELLLILVVQMSYFGVPVLVATPSRILGVTGVRPVLTLKSELKIEDSGTKIGDKIVWNLIP
jgi:hypothetical protein